MLQWSLIEQVKSMLEGGDFSQREIAILLNVSRGTVNAIANGRHRPARVMLNSVEELEVDDGPYERCGGCGGMVHKPCRLCHVRELKQVEKRQRSLPLVARRPR